MDDLMELEEFVTKKEAEPINPRHTAAKDLMDTVIGADVSDLDPKYLITPKGLLLLAMIKVFHLHVDDPRTDMVWNYISSWIRDTYGKEQTPVIAFNQPHGSFGTVDQSAEQDVPPPGDEDAYDFDEEDEQ